MKNYLDNQYPGPGFQGRKKVRKTPGPVDPMNDMYSDPRQGYEDVLCTRNAIWNMVLIKNFFTDSKF